MEDFIKELLEEETGEEAPVVDLCLDWSLVKEVVPARFQNIGGLEAFRHLEELSIQGHDLAKLTDLPHFPLLSRLNLSQNKLESLQGLPPFPQLEFLDLSLNEITDLKGFPSLTALKELHLSYNRLGQVDALPILPQLQKLFLTGNKALRKVESLTRLQQLEILYAKDCFADWTCLHDLPHLREAVLSPTGGKSLMKLAGMQSLNRLTLWCKGLESRLDIPPLPQLQSLAILEGPHLEHIVQMDHLPKLKTLELRNIGLKGLPSGIRKLNRLQEIRLQDMQNVDWRLLSELPSLDRVNLKGKLDTKGLEEFQKARPTAQITFH